MQRRKKEYFFYKAEGSRADQAVVKTDNVAENLRLYELLSLLCRPRAVPTRWIPHRHSDMLLELFYMLEVCCGSGASSRAMITYMRRKGREGRSLLIDIMTLDLLLLTYPELKPYLEDGSIIYFEACLTQMQQGDLQLLVEGLLGIPWSKLHSYHVSLACTTSSWACLSKNRCRTLEGAALDYEAQVVEKLLALTSKAAKDLHKVNGKALSIFESPKHGSFKSNAQVQAMLRIEGFWLVELDYCAGETLDGAVQCTDRRTIDKAG